MYPDTERERMIERHTMNRTDMTLFRRNATTSLEINIIELQAGFTVV